MLSSDVHIVLDTVLYSRTSFQTRNRIRGVQGEVWLTVPVHGKKVPTLDSLTVDKQTNWSARHWRTVLTTYGKIRSAELDWIRDLKQDRFADVAATCLERLSALLGIKIPVMHASDLRPDTAAQDADQRLIDLMAAVGGSEYVSGSMGRNYMNLQRWKDAGVAVTFCQWRSPAYAQEPHADFVPNLSVVDLVGRLGSSAARELIEKGIALETAVRSP
ncbi:MAG: WbqC family protein [Actinomycetota bacterium]|nr:WbqC family protein [Actinomycetota bacterium]